MGKDGKSNKERVKKSVRKVGREVGKKGNRNRGW